MRTISVEIGYRVRKKRKALGLTCDQLSESADISSHFLAEIERGKKGASAETIIKLCKSLKVSADYLLFGKTQSNDISEILSLLRNIELKYIHLIDEHIRIFLKTIDLLEAGEPISKDRVAAPTTEYIEK